MPKLGVNIDHVATVREARKTNEPDPVWAAAMAELGGADGITIHLREDRRHIQDRDLRVLRQTVAVKLNLEMATSAEIVAIACEVKPDQCSLVPEKREEITTEGGLDVCANLDRVRAVTSELKHAGLEVSLFIDPDSAQIDAAVEAGADAIELHTGEYANARAKEDVNATFQALEQGVRQGRERGLHVHMGHGLTYRNVLRVARVPGVEEFNIGHSIIARAVFVGMERAVREMKTLITV